MRQVPIVEESQKLKVAELVATAGAGAVVTIVDRPAVIDQVRLLYGRKFQYRVKVQSSDHESNVDKASTPSINL
eukprot:SAG31_NODE_135_length_23206_cov_25.707967_26_plen_74_part_00